MLQGHLHTSKQMKLQRMSKAMVWASAQGARGTGLLCGFCGEEDAHYLVRSGAVDCSKPFSSACTCTFSPGRKPTSRDISFLSWAAEQPQSWAPDLAQCKTSVVRGVPRHRGTHHLQCSLSRPTVLGKNLPPSPAGSAACMCALQQGTTCAHGLVPPCPLCLIQGKPCFLRVSCPSAAGRCGDSCSWFPLPATCTSWPLLPTPTLPWQGRL